MKFGRTISPRRNRCTAFTRTATDITSTYARPLSVISGHGGYDDGPAGYLFPPFHLEFGRMHNGVDRNKPVWYLPSWYRMTPENYRLERNTSRS